MPWDEVKEYIQTGELRRLLRLREVWFKYIARCEEAREHTTFVLAALFHNLRPHSASFTPQIEAEYDTLGDYILESVYHFETVSSSTSGKKRAVVPDLTEPVRSLRPCDHATLPDATSFRRLHAFPAV